VEKSVGCIGGRIIEKRRRRKEEGKSEKGKVRSKKWKVASGKRKEERGILCYNSAIL
jgi:hypothetical protein